MKRHFLCGLTITALALNAHISMAQNNVGVDVSSPTQKLDVNGAIRIGTTSNNVAGSIRYTGSDFQGYHGGQWVSLMTPAGLLSETLLNGRIFVGNASNVAAGVPMSGDATIINTGAITISNNAVTSVKILDATIVDADISATAGIARTKLAIGTANRLVVNNGSGVLSDMAAGTDGNILQLSSGAPAWVDASGVFIRNQNAAVQTSSNFWISGVGRAGTAFHSPVFSRATDGTVAVRATSDNSVTAIQLQNASGTSILNVDATNSRIGIGNSAPDAALEVTGDVLLSRAANRTLSVENANGSDGASLTVKSGDGQPGGIAYDGGDLVLQAGAGNNISGSKRGGDLILRSGTNQLTSSGQPNGGDILFATGGAANAFNTRMTLKESGVLVSHVNVYVDNNANGVILRSPNNNCWKLVVDNSGNLSTTSVTCP